jgi:hypothetical protein
MSVNAKMDGDKLILTIDVGGKPYVSKSAIAKAVAKGIDPAKLSAESVATSGGFIREGKFKYSVNVNLA